MKCRQRPIETMAFQMAEKAMRNRVPWPLWLTDTLERFPEGEKPIFKSDDLMFLKTRYGARYVAPGDWIFVGPDGTLTHCDQDEFNARFDPV